MRRYTRAILATLFAVATSAASAAELTIGTAGAPNSLDPHYYNTWTNVAATLHIFDRLIEQDPDQHLIPGLALSWRALDDTTWEFKLRPGVTFQDGRPFTADDVLFTLDRMPKVPNSPSSFVIYTSSIAKAEAVDKLTLRATTTSTYPLVPVNFSLFAIMGRAQSGGPAPEGKTTSQLNAGDGVIGTGPYRLVSWSPGDKLILARNPDYWRGPEPWDRVILQPIKDPGARVSALLSGDVDVIDGVPAEAIARLQSEPKLALYRKTTSRVMFVVFDTYAEPTPGVADTGGRNPLKDPRVRKALSLAINRDAIVERVMEGGAHAIGELLHPGAFGSNPDLRPDPYDPQQARALLADAGYPDGFSITLGAPNDGLEKASQISQAIAAMWTRIGVKTRVDAWTLTTFYGLRNKYQFSAYLSGAQSYTGEAAFLLNALVATPDAKTGAGVINKGRYSNPAVDAVLQDALRTLDDDKRAALLGKASGIAMADHGIVPLHAVVATWAVRGGLRFTPYTDTGTYAMAVRPDTLPR